MTYELLTLQNLLPSSISRWSHHKITDYLTQKNIQSIASITTSYHHGCQWRSREPEHYGSCYAKHATSGKHKPHDVSSQFIDTSTRYDSKLESCWSICGHADTASINTCQNINAPQDAISLASSIRDNSKSEREEQFHGVSSHGTCYAQKACQAEIEQSTAGFGVPQKVKDKIKQSIIVNHWRWQSACETGLRNELDIRIETTYNW